jgi:hypothetical protein
LKDEKLENVSKIRIGIKEILPEKCERRHEVHDERYEDMTKSFLVQKKVGEKDL